MVDMEKSDLSRVKFHSIDDMGGGYQLSKGEHILKGDTQPNYSDIDDILELYNIKKYFDNELYLKSWSAENIAEYKKKVSEFGKAIGYFVSNIDNTNVINLHTSLPEDYKEDFWELVNNQKAFKKISKDNFKAILLNEPHLIHIVLYQRELVNYYDQVIREFLKTYSKAAEILLSVYEVKDAFRRKEKFIPKSLSVADKEEIISMYLDMGEANYNYIEIIQNVRNRNDFKITDKTRLKAKRLHEAETEKFFTENKGFKTGVSITFIENVSEVKKGFIDDDHVAHFSYSLDFIKQNKDPYNLFRNFKYLFEFTDAQNRINLVSKKSQMGVFERVMGLRSQNEYMIGAAFSFTEMTSQAHIVGYHKIISQLGTSLEEILHSVFSRVFQERYRFPENARFSIPSTGSYFEKVRLLAPELESVLKQFKLFVEDEVIDFELLQISSSPTSIRDIPSLNQNKYIYFNEGSREMVRCSNLFFSDQTLLAYVEPYKGKDYRTFFDLLAHEEVNFNNYEEHQRPALDYLIEQGLIAKEDNGRIYLPKIERVLILKDLYDNEFASFYRYDTVIQKEATKMASENIVLFDSSLFAKPEQSYFNYFLNKSEFTNGRDLRNSYLHGTQAKPEDVQKHEYAYFAYMKLLVLTMLKLDDDLQIWHTMKNRT